TSAEAAEAATPASAPSDASPEPETPDPASTPVVDSPEPAEPAPGSAADLRAQADRLLAARRGALPSDLWRELFDSTLEAVEAFDDDDVLASSPLLSFLNQAAAAINPAADPVRGVLRPTVRAGAEVISATLSFSGKVVLLLMGAFFTGFFFFFISTGYPAVVDRLRSFIPEKHRDRTTDLATKFDAVINGFIRGRLTVAFVLGAFLSIAYFLIGVPGAFIVGPIIGVLSIAPYVSLVGIPISILLLLLDPSGFFSFQSHWLWAIAAPTVVYFIAQALDDYVLTPIIQGKATNMDTPTILFATLAGGALAGIYGVLLAIPVAACAKIALTELFWPRFKAWTEGKERDFLPISRD
ncbi:MAG: AI-2E family transporter, partial [Planctomycetota bacterium]